MALFETIRTWWGGLVNTATTVARTTANALTTPVLGTGGLVDATPAALRPILTPSDAEVSRQREVVLVRKYHKGLQDAKLTARLRQILGDDTGVNQKRINFIRKINRAPAQRMIVEGFDSDAEDENEKSLQIEFANAVWRNSRMKGKRAKLFTQVWRDGEAFILIDEDAENQRERWTPHQRYTDATVGGDGEGAWLYYPNDDTDQKPLYGIKRWTEHAPNTTPQPRLTVWYDNKIERFAEGALGWTLSDLVLPDGTLLPAEEWNTDTGLETGRPLGIPMVHVKRSDLESISLEAITGQQGLNKVWIDMLSASDMEAMRILIALGWEPPEGELEPGMWYYTTTPEASVHEVQPADSTRFIELIDKQVALMADLVDIPLSLLQRSAQRAAEGTLQEEKEDFHALIRDTMDTAELALEDALKISRRRHNVFFGVAGDPEKPLLDEKPAFSIKWKPLSVRSSAERATDAQAMIASQMPPQTVWRDAWNKTPEEVEAMQEEKKSSMGLYDELVTRTADDGEE